jgi:predicted RNA-binding Zn-ribbon protein involved in translation (DUF1610 family)
MPLPTTPMKISCQSCGWSKVAPQQGDVVFIPKKCERCGSEMLTKAKAGMLDKLKNLIS